MPQRPFPALSRPSSLANRQAQPPARAGRPGQGDKKKKRKNQRVEREEKRDEVIFLPPPLKRGEETPAQPYSFPSSIKFNSSFSFSLHPKWHLASEMSEERKKEDVG